MKREHGFSLRRAFSSTALLSVGLLIAGSLLILLTNQHRSLRSRYERLGETLRSPRPGLWFPAVETVSVQGDTVCIGTETALPQLLLFFTTTCEGCPEAFEDLRSLFEGLLSAGSARAVGISFDDQELTRTFVEERDPVIPVTVFQHRRWPDVFRIREVPQLVVLDSGGRVRVARSGAFSPQLLTDSILPLIQQLGTSTGSSPLSDFTPSCRATKTIHLRQGGLP